MKHGFTLAEILITLGIIGVVAALTAPSLVQNSGSAQVGPKLAKFSSSFEVANEKMLLDTGASRVKPIEGQNNAEKEKAYIKQLSNFMRITPRTDVSSRSLTNYDGSKNDFNKGGSSFYTNDGGWAFISFDEGTENLSTPVHLQNIGTVYYDINGISAPNALGKDVFIYNLYNDGHLEPNGVSGEWNGKCDKDGVTDNGMTCCGSIYENNLKVIYQ